MEQCIHKSCPHECPRGAEAAVTATYYTDVLYWQVVDEETVESPTLRGGALQRAPAPIPFSVGDGALLDLSLKGGCSVASNPRVWAPAQLAACSTVLVLQQCATTQATWKTMASRCRRHGVGRRADELVHLWGRHNGVR
jgi:hypothetical protein